MPLKSLRSFQQQHFLSLWQVCAHLHIFCFVFAFYLKAVINMNYKWVNMPARCWWKKQTCKSAAPPVFSSGLAGSGVDDGRGHWDRFLAWALTEKAACDFSSWCSCNYCGLVRFSWELLRLCFLGSWNYWSHWEFRVLAGSTFPIGWKALSFYFRPKGFLATFIKWQSLGAGKKPYKWIHFSGETEAQEVWTWLNMLC